MRVLDTLLVSCAVVEEEPHRCGLHKCLKKQRNHQLEEEMVVLVAHAVVEPLAVVVEFVDAAVAGAAVLGTLLDVSVARRTEVL